MHFISILNFFVAKFYMDFFNTGRKNCLWNDILKISVVSVVLYL